MKIRDFMKHMMCNSDCDIQIRHDGMIEEMDPMFLKRYDEFSEADATVLTFEIRDNVITFNCK